MIAFIRLLPLIFCLFIKGIGPQEIIKLSGYNLSSPSANIILPDILTEISGITSIDSTTFACVEDETGIVYIYDSRKGEIVNHVSFAFKGDFEDIARINRSLYILRSDGILYEISDYLSEAPAIKTYDTGIPVRESEGLCYDEKNRRLLIACKQGYMDDIKNKQLVYSFDLSSKKLSSVPVISIDIKLLRKQVKETDFKIPGVDKDKIDEIEFHASGIAINPVTGKVFLISAADNLLIVTDMLGKPESIESLKKDYFRQPEGITFNKKGDLYISSEGSGKKPHLVRFNYRRM